MSVLTPEMLMAIGEIVQQVLRGMPQTGVGQPAGREERHRRVLHEKMFRRLDRFSGGESAYKSWAFDMEVILKAECKPLVNALKEVNGKPVIQSGKELEQSDGIEFDHMEERAAELYDCLILMTQGEAKMMIKDAEDGIVAWEILRRSYSRKTLARTLRNYQVILNPGQAKINELVGGIAKWEAAVKDVEKEDGTPLPQMVKMAGFTELCPQDIKENIFESLNRDGGDELRGGARSYHRPRE